MKFLVPALLLLSACTLLHADSIPTFVVTQLDIHNQTTMTFSGPGITGTGFSTGGIIPVCCDTALPVTNAVIVFGESDIFAEFGSSKQGSVDFGSGTMAATYQAPQSCGSDPNGTFPSTVQVTLPNFSPATGTSVTVTAPVSFCGVFPMWLNPNGPSLGSPDFFVSMNLQGTGTFTLISQGQFVSANGQTFTLVSFGGLDYHATATPEPATFALLGVPLLIGAVKRFRATRT